MQRKPSCGTTKSTLCTVSKDEWNTKEDTGTFMKNVLYVLQLSKAGVVVVGVVLGLKQRRIV